MNERLAKKIEIIANVAIIIAAISVSVFFAKNWIQRRAASGVETGTQFALKDAHWQSSNKNVVLALSTTCHFCTESAGFYRELVEQCRQNHVHTIAVLPQSSSEATQYLKGEGVKVDDIRQVQFRDLHIKATPTLLVVDGRGKVKDVWTGKLSGSREKEVLAKLN